MIFYTVHFFLKGNTVHFNLQDEHMVHPKNYYFVGLLPFHFAKLGPDCSNNHAVLYITVGTKYWSTTRQKLAWSLSSSCYFAIVHAVCFLFVCIFFQCFFSSSPLYFCVGQALFGCIKIVYVTSFLLMKNLLRHGCEKKYINFGIKSHLNFPVFRGKNILAHKSSYHML